MARNSISTFHRYLFVALLATTVGPVPALGDSKDTTSKFRLATFSADVTIPLGHRCMGVLPTKSKKVADPLSAHGFVLTGGDLPVVLCAVDWCEIRNESYDQWRDALARAAGTRRERVLVCSVHQHDAPVIDGGAEQLLTEVGLQGELHDEAFHKATLDAVVKALTESLAKARPVTHLGMGEARVVQVASNRRVVMPDGRVTFSRGSSSGRVEIYRKLPEGLIDPLLKTLSFWDGDQPLLAVQAYATHPMSYYGQGEVSCDFVGLARNRRQRDDPSIKQIYVTGCSGDVTAGKFNDGSRENRPVLADRVYQAMTKAWQETRRVPLETVTFRNTKLVLEFHPAQHLTDESLRATVNDPNKKVEERILAAMGLSSRQRVASGQAIDVPCIDLGSVQVVLLPGESFVGYQLMAQEIHPDSFVFAIGFGECWPGYIPTESAFEDNFTDKWMWVAPGSESRMRAALETALLPKK